MDGISFVERINELLKLKGKSKAEFYKDLNLANNSITAWGVKNQIPSADTALKIAQYLHTSVEYLLTGIESDEYKIKYDKLMNNLQTLITEH